MTGGAEPFDVITMGRVGVDLYPLQSGVRLDEVETFGKFLGGSPTNVAVAAARHGRRAAVITRTGADPFGRFVRRALAEYEVDARFVADVPDLPTPVTFCELFPPDDFPLYFYRHPKAPDLEIRAEELDRPAIETARVLWTTMTGLCAEPSRSATLAALSWRHRADVTVVDLDHRPMFWESAAEARRAAGEALEHATVAVGNTTECEVAVGESDPLRAARALLDRGVRLAVVKRGPDGVLAVDSGGETVESPPVPVKVVNGLGAGDAFGGALCHGLLSGWDLPRVMGFANAAGAIVASRLACAAAMPDGDEVEALMGETAP
ncbi:5-dehydro-2-deoxygluconokinase [Actinomadura spongiicola]|uniref:5-dehydro-2-deoxygluconokinase n=1 Tax=Actinomadura spongiicola TaxID=2303421 RepID=A0A372GHK3_9ACTN|nr:5-dehydro-2-deoxygluconokinase [Actinomadura spongiicola]RFS84856.1 5-dehydro-2-deoxygluconokinase [Actinomadura spongiicola]